MANPHQLFVEGADDQNVIVQCIAALRPQFDGKRIRSRGFHIDSAGSDEHQALARFLTDAKGSADGTSGLVIDADDRDGGRVSDRWAAIRNGLAILIESGLPEAPVVNGWVGRTTHGRALGVWIMPNNQSDGALEAFLLPMVPDGPLWNHAKASADASKSHGAQFKAAHASKAHLHTFLAWHHPPGRPYGESIAKGALRATQNPVAEQFAQWFERLYAAVIAPG